MSRLKTTIGEKFYEEHRELLRQFLREVDLNVGMLCSPAIEFARQSLASTKVQHNDGHDELLNDIYVLGRYIEFFECYGRLWRLIAEEKFSASWIKLQDAFDLLRLVRRFSDIDVSGLEDQLAELEKTYPYNVFFSIGAQVDKFECSICSHDIDSFECTHRGGQLYRGRMAVGIARNIVNFDHVAFVDKPEDKRCVVSYDDNGEEFKLVRFLSRLLQQRSCSVSDFGLLVFSTRIKPNPEYRKTGRNDPCFCGSGIKFKRCCITKAHIEGDHVDITIRPLNVERAIA